MAVLQELHRRDVQSVLVEGGGGVHRSFLDAGLIDRLHLFVAPKVLAAGRGWISGSGYALADAPRLRMVAVNLVGDDAELVLEA